MNTHPDRAGVKRPHCRPPPASTLLLYKSVLVVEELADSEVELSRDLPASGWFRLGLQLVRVQDFLLDIRRVAIHELLVQSLENEV